MSFHNTVTFATILLTLTFGLELASQCRAQNVMAQCNENRTLVEINGLVTRLISPSTSSTGALRPCSFQFRKDQNICQIKLEFISFTTMGANPEGDCETDKLKISGSVTVQNGFTTCGLLTGQRMYLAFRSQNTIEVTPILRSVGSAYDILATRIPCESRERVPDHCLQHYTTPTGRVMSFDFGRQQQNDQRYTVCVKPDPQSTGVQWRPCSGTSRAVDIVSNFGVTATVCDKDWLQIKGENRFCEGFTQITSFWKPYDLLVNFDASEFPPEPPTFTKPITGHCDEEINCLSDGMLVCGCVATDQPSHGSYCECIIDYINVLGAPMPDLNNTGFCLDYSQL